MRNGNSFGRQLEVDWYGGVHVTPNQGGMFYKNRKSPPARVERMREFPGFPKQFRLKVVSAGRREFKMGKYSNEVFMIDK